MISSPSGSGISDLKNSVCGRILEAWFVYVLELGDEGVGDGLVFMRTVRSHSSLSGARLFGVIAVQELVEGPLTHLDYQKPAEMWR